MRSTPPKTAPRQVAVLLGDPGLPDRTKVNHRFSAEDMEAVTRLKEALADIPQYEFHYLNRHDGLIADLAAKPPTLVLNLCDTGYRNDAARELHIPALLELLEIPYTGSGPACLGMCFDKALVRAVAKAHGLPVPQEIFCEGRERDPSPPFGFPALMKPNRGDGSIGITQQAVVHSREEAALYLDRMRKDLPGEAVLIQEFLSGQEYGLALIGNPGEGFTVLPLLEVDYSALDPSLPRILSYESKTIPESPYWTQIKYREARLDLGARERLIASAALLFKRLGCRDYARFDFRADGKGIIKLLEINPNPAWCWDGKLNMMAEFGGHRYSDLFRLLLKAAETRLDAAQRTSPADR